MTEDLNKIQDGIGEKMGMLVRFVVTFFGSIIYPFTQNWLISLVISSVLPLLAIFGGLMGAIMTKVSKVYGNSCKIPPKYERLKDGLLTSLQDEMRTYGKAGAIAEEVLSSIRTVTAFGGQQKEVDKYSAEVVTARKNGIFRQVTNWLHVSTLHN